MLQEAIEKNKGLLHRFATWAVVAGCVLLVFGAMAVVSSAYFCFHSDVFGNLNRYYQFISGCTSTVVSYFFPMMFLFGTAALARWTVNRERPMPWLVRNGHVIIYLYVGFYGAASIWWTLKYATRPVMNGQAWPENYDYLLLMVKYLLAFPKLLLWVYFAMLLRKGVSLFDGAGNQPSLREAVEQNKGLLHFLANTAGVIGLVYVALCGIEAHGYWTKYMREAAEMIRWADSGTDLAVQYFLPAVFMFGIYGFVQCILDRGYPILPVLTYGDKLIYVYVALRILAPALMFGMYHPQLHSSSWSSILMLAAIAAMQLISLIPLVVWVLFGMIVRSGMEVVKESRVMVQAK